MNRAPVLVLFLAMLFLFGLRLTGFVSTDAGTVSFTVGPPETGNITAFAVPAAAFNGTASPLNTTFENIGSFTYSATISIFVSDNTSAIVFSATDTTVTLTPGQTRTFATSYAVPIPGNYSALTNVSFSLANVVTKNATFPVADNQANETHLACVSQACVTVSGAGTNACSVNADCQTQAASGGGGLPTGGAAAPTTTAPHLTILAPAPFTIAPGQTLTLPLIIRNTGNGPANSVSLAAFSDDLSVTIDPAFFTLLPAGQQRAVVLLASASPTAPEQNTTILLTASALETTASNQTVATIAALPVDQSLWNEIDNLRFLIAVLEGELEHARSTGADVSEAAELLTQAAQAVDQAAQALETEDLDTAKAQATVARELLIRVARLLVEARPPRLVAGAPSLWPAFLVVAVAVCCILLAWARRRKREKQRSRNRRKHIFKRNL